MSYPMLAPSNTWYASSTARSTFTTINIVDVADESIISSATESWAAAVDSNGDGAFDNDIMCYVNGTTLTIAGNGGGKIYANPDSSSMFGGSSVRFDSITAINGANILDTSKVETMFRMFDRCSKLVTVDVSNWDVSKVTTLQCIFQGCYVITGLDLSKWNTSNVTNMGFMFHSCSALNTVDVSNWDVSKVTDFDHMFAHSHMSGIDVSKWDTSSATNMYALFHTVKNTTIDVSSFDTSKVEAFGQMFEYMSQLTEIKGLENFDTSKGIDFDEMFHDCTKLTKLDLSSFDTRKATFNEIIVSSNGGKALSTWSMFDGMSNLQEIKLGKNFTFTGDGTAKNGYPYGMLPAPSSSHIYSADGNWYTANRIAYTPSDIPNNTVATYYASVDLVNNIDYLVKNGTMLDIADAIRATSGSTDKMTPSTMIENVHEIAEINNDLEEALYSTSEGGKSWYDKYMEMISLHPEKTVSGSYLTIDGVSELPHEVKCKVSGVDNPQSVTVTRCGANLWEGADVYTITGTGANQSLRIIDELIKTTQTFSCVVALEDVEYSATGNLVFFYATYADGTGASLSIVTTSTTSGAVSAQFTASEENPIVKMQMNAHGRFTGGTITLSDIMLNRGTTALPYEPYNEQTLTPSTDGTVEGMTSTYPQMSIFTDNVDAMLDVTYRISAGKQAEYDRFWDAFQQDGNRTDYRQAFTGVGWTAEIFKPKYDMHVTNGYMMFMNSQMSVDLPYTLGVMLDFANCTNKTTLQYTFNSTRFTRIGVVDGRKAGQFFDTFGYSYYVYTIDKIICDENTTFTNNCFVSCNALANITFEGVIGSTINFQWCPLTKASITNIIEHLSSTATGQTCTFKKSAKEAAFTADEWSALIANKTNWTFSLV